jgi:hypothetical protein
MSSRKFLTTVRTKKRKDQPRFQKGFFLVEKRENPRYSVELPFGYSLADIEETRAGILADACEGGLLAYLHRRVDIGTQLKIEILYAKGFRLDTIKGIAKVVWSDFAAKESFGEYRYGLKFQSFQEGDIDKLRILLKKVSQSRGEQG